MTTALIVIAYLIGAGLLMGEPTCEDDRKLTKFFRWGYATLFLARMVPLILLG